MQLHQVFFLLLVATFQFVLGTVSSEPIGRIIGGSDAQPNSIPFQVFFFKSYIPGYICNWYLSILSFQISFQYRADGFHFCSGSIVNEVHINLYRNAANNHFNNSTWKHVLSEHNINGGSLLPEHESVWISSCGRRTRFPGKLGYGAGNKEILLC